MTFLGKLCVMINVGISLMMAFAAVALYFNGVDWGYDVAEPGKAGGVLKQKQDEIKDVGQIQPASEDSWKRARPVLWQVEQERREARAEFVAQLEWNRNTYAEKDGKGILGPDGKPYLLGAQTPEAARPVVDQAGKPILGPDLKPLEVKVGPARSVEVKNLRAVGRAKQKYLPNMPDAKVREVDAKDPNLYGRVYYQNELQKENEKNHNLLAELKKEFQKDADYTKQIYDKETDPPSGLQVELVAERIKRDGIRAERRLIRPLYVNTAVESELSLKRLAAMKKQIADLKAYATKRGMDLAVTKR